MHLVVGRLTVKGGDGWVMADLLGDESVLRGNQLEGFPKQRVEGLAGPSHYRAISGDHVG
jgi:hypothetical protein